MTEKNAEPMPDAGSGLSSAERRLLAAMPLHAITSVHGETGLRERLLMEITQFSPAARVRAGAPAAAHRRRRTSLTPAWVIMPRHALPADMPMVTMVKIPAGSSPEAVEGTARWTEALSDPARGIAVFPVDHEQDRRAPVPARPSRTAVGSTLRFRGRSRSRRPYAGLAAR